MENSESHLIQSSSPTGTHDCDSVPRLEFAAGRHWVIFTDGNLELLEYFASRLEEEREEAGEGVVGPGEEILQARVVELAARTDVVYLVSGRGELAVVRATVLLDTARATHSLTNTTRLSVCPAAEVN